MQKFSLLMSVYEKENPEYLKEAFASVLNSSVKPSQFVLIKDGKLTEELEEVISSVKDSFSSFLEYEFKVNKGLGLALKKGVELCEHNLIARFDSDDLCDVSRFELQLNRFSENNDLVVLGGAIQEFADNKKDYKRVVPLTNEDIKEYSRKRNPFNHMTVMFKKDKILECGNYKDLKGFEDYYLWLRVIDKGYYVENLENIIVYARAGIDMVSRRRGLNYIKQTIRAYNLFYKEGLISKSNYYNEITRRVVFSVIPIKIQYFLYKKLLRK